MTVWQAGSMVLMVHERLLQQITRVLRWWVRQVRCARSTVEMVENQRIGQWLISGVSRANGRLPSIGVMPGGAVRTVLSKKPHVNRVSWRGGVRRETFEST